MVFNSKRTTPRSSLPKVQQNTQSIRNERQNDMKQMFSLNKLVRPSLAFVLSLLYGTYMDNREFLSSRELVRGGIMVGSVLGSDILGNMLLPHLAVSKNVGIREIENMVIEPVISGVINAGAVYYLLDGDSSNLTSQFIKGAGIDLISGFGEGIITNVI